MTLHHLYRFCCCLLLVLSLLQTAVAAGGCCCPTGPACQSESGPVPADESSPLSDLDEESGLIMQVPSSCLPSAHLMPVGPLLILPPPVEKTLFTPPE